MSDTIRLTVVSRKEKPARRARGLNVFLFNSLGWNSPGQTHATVSRVMTTRVRIALRRARLGFPPGTSRFAMFFPFLPLPIAPFCRFPGCFSKPFPDSAPGQSRSNQFKPHQTGLAGAFSNQFKPIKPQSTQIKANQAPQKEKILCGTASSDERPDGHTRNGS